MPKKFKGENSKAVEAKARKAAVQHEAAEVKRREVEDALWVDDDKQLAKKAQRKVSVQIVSCWELLVTVIHVIP